MTLSLDRSVAVIDGVCEALAADAAGRFDEPVAGCPGWRVRDVLAHLVEVHWFWATIVEGRLAAPPTEGRPTPVADDHLISAFLLGARRLTGALAGADQSASVWTWAPGQRDVAFVTRHQIQEAAVHGYDVAAAVGAPWPIDTDVAADAVEEFLTFSVSSRLDPAEPVRPALDGALALVARDVQGAWTVTDDDAPGTVRFAPGAAPGAAVLEGSAADLLLWLYRRVHLEGEEHHAALVGRFRALTFTD